MTAKPTPSPTGVVRLADPLDGVALWLCDLERRAQDIERLARVLSSAEHQRAARFGTEALRNRWIAGRATLRELLAAIVDTTPDRVPLRRGRRGRPEVAIDTAPDFNVSHTADVAIIAIGIGLPGDTRIGADIERADRDVGVDRLARKLLTARERSSLDGLDLAVRRARFVRTWTCKEAMSKATADGLIAPFRDIDIDLGPPPTLVAGPSPYEPSRWTLLSPAVRDGFVATLALWRMQRPSPLSPGG